MGLAELRDKYLRLVEETNKTPCCLVFALDVLLQGGVEVGTYQAFGKRGVTTREEERLLAKAAQERGWRKRGKVTGLCVEMVYPPDMREEVRGLIGDQIRREWGNSGPEAGMMITRSGTMKGVSHVAAVIKGEGGQPVKWDAQDYPGLSRILSRRELGEEIGQCLEDPGGEIVAIGFRVRIPDPRNYR